MNRSLTEYRVAFSGIPEPIRHAVLGDQWVWGENQFFGKSSGLRANNSRDTGLYSDRRRYCPMGIMIRAAIHVVLIAENDVKSPSPTIAHRSLGQINGPSFDAIADFISDWDNRRIAPDELAAIFS